MPAVPQEVGDPCSQGDGLHPQPRNVSLSIETPLGTPPPDKPWARPTRTRVRTVHSAILRPAGVLHGHNLLRAPHKHLQRLCKCWSLVRRIRSLWRTRAVGMVPVSDAPRRWSDCTVPPPADASACLPMPAPAYRSQHLPLLPSLSHPRRRVPSVRPTGNFQTRGTFRSSRTGSHPQRKYRPRRPER